MKVGDAVMLRSGPKRECGHVTELRDDGKAIVRVARGHRWHEVVRAVVFLEVPPCAARACAMCGRLYWPDVTVNSDALHCSDPCFDASLQVNPRRHNYDLDSVRRRVGYDPNRDPDDVHSWAF